MYPLSLNVNENRLDIHIARTRGSKVNCPVCGKECSVDVPWTRKNSGFTLLFEAFIMTLVRNIPVNAITKIIGTHSDRLWRVIDHYVEIAHASVDFTDIINIGIDETSNKRGHDYITLFVDLDESKVLYATEGNGASTIASFKEIFENQGGEISKVEHVSCDMSPAFISGINKNIPEAKIIYDKFHAIKRVNEEVNDVRRTEIKENEIFKGTRYLWLKKPVNLTNKQLEEMKSLSNFNLKTLRAYNIKLSLQKFYTITDPVSAEAHL